MVFLVIILWILLGVGGYHLGKEKTIGAAGGAALGLFLGLIGIIIILCLPSAEKPYDTRAYDAEIERSYEKMNEAAATAKATAPDELQKWFDLKEKGVISEEEFQAKKRELM